LCRRAATLQRNDGFSTTPACGTLAVMAVDVYTAPFHVYPGSQRAFLVLCDHASNAVPKRYGSLGLGPHELERHIAWDIGARGVALALASKLDCPVILGGSSRLLVDLNRCIDDPTSILGESDNTIVPRNLAINDEERAARIRQFHMPYHARIGAHLDALLARGVRPTLISVHSFSPSLGSIARPWPVAVLWKQAREPVAALIHWFVAQGFLVGDNRPYDARILLGWTLEHHAVRRDLPHVLFEMRNDGIETVRAQRVWAARLYRAMVETRFGLT
jgi:predicted N-formylglutamate amidohydrolase